MLNRINKETNKMVYTITLNPSVDYFIHTDSLVLGEINRVNNCDFFAGGKGINVSRLLDNLDVKSVACGFVGGFTGSFIKEELNKSQIKTNFVELDGNTRVNVKINSGVDTEINGAGINISKNNLDQLIRKIKTDIVDGDYLVLSGSVPASTVENVYGYIIKELPNAKVVLDTTCSNLLDNLKYKPFLIKPNDKELAEMFNVEINSLNQIVKYGKKLKDFGAVNVMISLGKDGAVLISDSGIYQATVPVSEVINAVGAGDSTVAGFISRCILGETMDMVLQFACACGTATATCRDLATKDYIYNVLEKISIKKIG